MKVWVVVEETRNLSSRVLGVFTSLEGADQHRQFCMSYGYKPSDVFYSALEFETDASFCPVHVMEFWKKQKENR